MAEPFLSEIRICSFGFAPKGWALCNGQLLPINQNQALFSLLGTTFGGDGRVNFALPDLQGRTPIHTGSGYTLGQRGGEQAHTLSASELPTHTHAYGGSNNLADAASPAGGVFGRPSVADANGGTQTGNAFYGAASVPAVMAAGSAVANAGGSQAHNNMQPYLVLSFVIALQGIFPSRN